MASVELPARTAPVARISSAAVRANIAALELDPGTAVGLAGDAFGHGFTAVARLVTDAGLVADADATAHGPAVLGLVAGGIPALRLSGTVLSAKTLLAGEGVSYGYAHRADRDTRVALVVGGYAQGIVRGLGGRVAVSVAGGRHPLVGRVAMDVCVVDVGDAAVERGDEVVFFGDTARDEPSLADWVTAAGLSAAEIVTTVGLRAQREWS